MTRLVKLFFGAVAFMTRLPVPQKMQCEPDALSSAAVFFPLVGLLVSAGAIILNHVFSRFVPRDVVLVMVLIFLVAITGGFHEDALADAADGFGGGWSKDQILTIMRDSRVEASARSRLRSPCWLVSFFSATFRPAGLTTIWWRARWPAVGPPCRWRSSCLRLGNKAGKGAGWRGKLQVSHWSRELS